MVWVVVGAVDGCRKSRAGKWIGLDTLEMRERERSRVALRFLPMECGRMDYIYIFFL